MPIECWLDEHGNPVRVKTGMTLDDLELDVAVDVDAPPADQTISADEAGIPIDG